MDISMHDLHLSSTTFFHEGRLVKSVKQASWLLPPSGVLKLNFDGSFIKEEQEVDVEVLSGQLRSNLMYLLWPS